MFPIGTVASITHGKKALNIKIDIKVGRQIPSAVRALPDEADIVVRHRKLP